MSFHQYAVYVLTKDLFIGFVFLPLPHFLMGSSLERSSLSPTVKVVHSVVQNLVKA